MFPNGKAEGGRFMKSTGTAFYGVKTVLNMQHQKRVAHVVFLFMLGFIYVFTECLIYAGKVRLGNLENRLQMLSDTKKQTDELSVREMRLQEKVLSINEISKSQIKWSPVIESLIYSIPDGVRVIDITGNKNEIIIKCTGDSMNTIIDYTSELESCRQLRGIDMVEVYHEQNKGSYRFSIRVRALNNENL